MRRLIFLFAIVLCCQCLAQEAVSKDATEVYKTYFSGYTNDSNTTLKIADRTVVFAPTFTDDSAMSCLKEIHLKAVPGTQTHILDTSILPDGMTARFINKENAKQTLRDPGDAIRRGESVDQAVKRGFAAGVLTFSEVVFNQDHTRAVLSYSFRCGKLCGHGGGMLFEKHNGHWIKGKRVCGEWLS